MLVPHTRIALYWMYTGSANAVETAFNLHLLNYKSTEGNLFYASDTEPSVPADIANVISGVVGLDNAHAPKPNSQWIPMSSASRPMPQIAGSGPGGLSPQDIQNAYSSIGNPSNFPGGGETLGLFEQDGYNASDVNAYVSYFSSYEHSVWNTTPPLQAVSVDGFSNYPHTYGGGLEVTLDIELQIALASLAKKIIIYETPNTQQGTIDGYNRIASDNQAKEISSSWGQPEQNLSSSFRSAENHAFQQMAAQGQSIYVASGDGGAYANGSTLSVQDPASQPFVVSVGGTELQSIYPISETTWMGTLSGVSKNRGGSGGGISTVWSIPNYQQPVITYASLGSTTMRNVPDVALNSSYNSPYAVYYQGAWGGVFGTSCAAPLWAAYTADVNAIRVAGYQYLGGVKPRLGFMNPVLYKIGQGTRYEPTNPYWGPDFNDIADGSNNLYYPAVTGYDLATGWGSFALPLQGDLEYY